MGVQREPCGTSWWPKTVRIEKNLFPCEYSYAADHLGTLLILLPQVAEKLVEG